MPDIIVDRGASEHVVFDKRFQTDVKVVITATDELATGAPVTAVDDAYQGSKEGDKKFFGELIAYRILN